MAKIDRKLLQELREKTGLGLMDCRKALEETGGNIEKSIELLKSDTSLSAFLIFENEGQLESVYVK